MIGFGKYGRKRKLGTEYQYYAFLVWLINKLVCGGWSIKKAMEAIVLNSTDLGHYSNSENAEHELVKTGSRMICGVYDLANTYKLLSCTNKEAAVSWCAGGSYDTYGHKHPHADLNHNNKVL